MEDRRELECPIDGESICLDVLFHDVCAQRELFNMRCFCINKRKKCRWIGEFSRLDQHISVCEFTDTPCIYQHNGCTVVVPRNLLSKHLKDECSLRLVICEYCKIDYQVIDRDRHLEECQGFQIECPHACGEVNITRRDLKHHELSCHSMKRPCFFNAMGCDFMGPKKSLDEHMRSNMEKHLILSGERIQDLSELLKTTQVSLVASLDLNKTYEAKISEQKETVQFLQETSNKHQTDIVALATAIKNLTAELNARDNVSKRVQEFEERLSVIGSEITRLDGDHS